MRTKEQMFSTARMVATGAFLTHGGFVKLVGFDPIHRNFRVQFADDTVGIVPESNLTDFVLSSTKFSVHVFRRARRGATVTVVADDESHAAAEAFAAVFPGAPVRGPLFVRNDGASYFVEGVPMWVSPC